MKNQKLSDIFKQTFEEVNKQLKSEVVEILRDLEIMELRVQGLHPKQVNEIVLKAQQRGFTNRYIEKLVLLTYEQIRLSGHQPPLWLDFFYSPPSMISLQRYELELLSSRLLTNEKDRVRDLILWISFSGLPLDRSAGYMVPTGVEDLRSLSFKPFENHDHTSYMLDTSLIKHFAAKYPAGLPAISEAEFRDYAEKILVSANINRRVELLNEAMDFKDPFIVPIPYVFRSRFCLITSMLFQNRYCLRSPFREYVQQHEYYEGKRIRKFVDPHLYIRWV